MASELEFGLQTREELDEAGIIMARAYEDYDYLRSIFLIGKKAERDCGFLCNAS